MFTLERPATNGHVSTVILEPPRRRPRWWFAAAALLIVVAIVASIVVIRSRAGAVTYTTVPVQTGALAQTVTASGTLNPQNTINVGVQVSGIISELDADYNSKVKKGQVLAKLDPTTFQASLDQAQATLAQSEAQAVASGATASGGPSAIAEAQAQTQAAADSVKAAQQTADADDAAVTTAQTNVTKDQSALQLAQATVNRDQQLLAQGYIAQSQMDTDQSNLVAAQSTLASARAAVTQAQAQASAAVAQIATANAQEASQNAATGVSDATAENQVATHDAAVANIGIEAAQVKTAQANLNNTIITSPVNGTVIARDVSIGQTVAASLQTPTLFSIAQDLTKMELDLAVGEPDIGHVQPGDPVSFSVLAYPNRVFNATVEQVRKDPTTVSNVVTYTVVVIVQNPDNVLLPGMTANATIQVAHVANGTIVPLAALSFTPPAGSIGHGKHRPASATAANGSSAKPNAGANANSSAATSNASPWGGSVSAGGAVTSGSTGRIFVERGGKLTPVPVTVGLVNETEATVTPLRGTLSATDQVVIADAHGSSGSHAAARNPLAGSSGPTAGSYGRGGALGGAR